MKFNCWLLSATALLTLVGPSAARADVWYVRQGTNLYTIQAGLDSARTGDTVLVAVGNYAERVVWPQTPMLRLLSEFGPDSTCVEPDSAGRVLYMDIAPAGAVVDGFTIRHGWARGSGLTGSGGGICCLSCAPEIRNCVISANGGGIYAESSSPHLRGNIIEDNSATGDGGGLYCSGGSPEVSESRVSGNSGTTGGGVCLTQSGFVMTYCQLLGNNASYGDGLNTDEDDPRLNHSNVFGNGVGVRNTRSYYYMNAVYNWWGDSLGAVPPGDVTEGNVTWSPWLSEEVRFDLAAMAISSPPGAVRPGVTYTPALVVTNSCNYAYPASFFTARCRIGDYHSYVRVDTTLAPGSSMEVRFSPWTVPPAESAWYTMVATVRYAVDLDQSNDTLQQAIFARSPGIAEGASPSPSARRWAGPSVCRGGTRQFFPGVDPVAAEIRDVSGRLVRVLPAGSPAWDGRDWSGQQVPSGAYVGVVRSESGLLTERLVVAR
jgi:predicted outer membrane repeat protein